jgi:hypothetical protein
VSLVLEKIDLFLDGGAILLSHSSATRNRRKPKYRRNKKRPEGVTEQTSAALEKRASLAFRRADHARSPSNCRLRRGDETPPCCGSPALDFAPYT